MLRDSSAFRTNDSVNGAAGHIHATVSISGQSKHSLPAGKENHTPNRPWVVELGFLNSFSSGHGSKLCLFLAAYLHSRFNLWAVVHSCSAGLRSQIPLHGFHQIPIRDNFIPSENKQRFYHAVTEAIQPS